MALINWPELLPADPLLEGFSKQPQSNVIRTAMDSGPRKSRRRYTARAVRFSFKHLFSAVELAVFEQFYHHALADGALRFSLPDPVSGETAEFRFAEDYTVNALDGQFEVAMTLERL
jgi:hypothetical protein